MTVRHFSPTRPVEVAIRQGEVAPAIVRWRGRNERIVAVEETWHLEEGWWRALPEATRRQYYRLRAASGLICTIYRDLGSGRWYLEQISD